MSIQNNFTIFTLVFLYVITSYSSAGGVGTAAMCLSWEPREACPQYCWDGPPRCGSDIHFSEQVILLDNMGGAVYFYVSGSFLASPVLCGSCSFSCDHLDPCCGNIIPCCGSNDPCCGIKNKCCDSDDRCCDKDGDGNDKGKSSGGG